MASQYTVYLWLFSPYLWMIWWYLKIDHDLFSLPKFTTLVSSHLTRRQITSVQRRCVCGVLQEGMGQLRIVTGGIQLSGQAMVLDALLASSIRSRRGQPITVESSRNFTINTRDEGGRIVNRIFLGESQWVCIFGRLPRGWEWGQESRVCIRMLLKNRVFQCLRIRSCIGICDSLNFSLP